VSFSRRTLLHGGSLVSSFPDLVDSLTRIVLVAYTVTDVSVKLRVDLNGSVVRPQVQQFMHVVHVD
jgi:hypothetical protein